MGSGNHLSKRRRKRSKMDKINKILGGRIEGLGSEEVLQLREEVQMGSVLEE